MEKVFCLFAGRHPIPGNPPAIFKEGIDPMDFDALHAAANAEIPAECTEVSVYVTGLTQGMLAVVEVCFQRGITLKAMHYDKETGEYRSQFPLVYDHCQYCGSSISRFDRCCPNCGS